MGTLIQDLSYAFRSLRRSPGFALVAIVTLALGIGVNATVFSVVNSVLVNPLPMVDKDGLVTLRTWQIKSGDESAVSYPNFKDWRDGTRAFQGMAAYHDDNALLTGRGGEPEEVPVERVTPNLFPLLGVRPLLGRTFRPEEGVQGQNHVVLLTHKEWVRRFDADPRVVGSSLTLDGVAHTVVGVMPENFGFPDNQPFWMPLVAPREADRRVNYLRVIARLRPDVTMEQGQADLDAVARGLATRFPESNAGNGVRAFDFRERWAGPSEVPLLVAMGAVGFVLMIACANVASLLLARAASRRREIAVRTAMGAGRARLVRQLLTESVVVALLGGALGVPLAWWGLRAIRTSFPFDPPFGVTLQVDGTVLLFVVGVSVATGILFGVVPALRATEEDLQGTLRDGGRGSTLGARRGRLQSALVAGQLALSLVLLVGATLMVRSFLYLQSADPGFRVEGALTGGIAASGPRYTEEEARLAFARQVLDRIRTIPGVQTAGLANSVPFSGGMNMVGYMVDEREVPFAERPSAEVRIVTDGFLEAQGVRVIAGRPFTAEEAARDAPVAVVSRDLAERSWPGQSAVGRQVSLGKTWRTIVGVVDGVSSQHRGSVVPPQLYIPSLGSLGRMHVVVRTTGDPAALAPAVRRAIHEVDPLVPVVQLSTLAEVANRSLWMQRLFGGMFITFGTIAFLLSVAGVYAMMAYAVAQRTHEIGVRMALGARTRQVLQLVVGQGLMIALVGVAAGLAGAFAVTRLMAGIVEGVSPTDPATFIGVALLLGGVTLLASWIPARRATRVDPMVALRGE